MNEFVAKFRGKLFFLICRILRRNIQIGNGLRLYKKFSVKGKGKITIGENCHIDGIRGDPRQYVTLDTLRDDAVITIGGNVRLYAARVSARFHVEIGDDVIIEESGIVDTDFHTIDERRSLPVDENINTCKIVIGNHACIGARSVITKGTTIGEDAVIAPGSVVKGIVLPGSFVIGNPARKISIKKL